VRQGDNLCRGALGGSTSEGQWISESPPRLKTSLQRPDTDDSSLAQEERHTGARGLVGSSAVQYHVAVSRDFMMALLDFLGKHTDGAHNLGWVSFELETPAQVNHHQSLTRVHSVK